MAYTKLFGTLLTSTMWDEDDKTRLVWITMLALSDKNGEVAASIPGLARLANVDIEATEKAIEKFLSPDKYSRTKDEEGRRIVEIDGGWFILNHAKYRKMASREDEKEKAAERKRRQRARGRNCHEESRSSHASVTPKMHIADTEAEAEAEAYTEAKEKKKSTSDSCSAASGKTLTVLPSPINELWDLCPDTAKRRSSKKSVKGAWGAIPAAFRPEQDELLSAYKAWLKTEDWEKDNGKFIPGLHRWVKDRQWENIPKPSRPASGLGPLG